MAKLRFEMGKAPMSGKLWVNGAPLDGVRSVSLNASVGDIPHARIDLIACDTQFEVDVDADFHVTLPPGFELISEMLGGGVVRWSMHPVKARADRTVETRRLRAIDINGQL